MSDVKPYYQEYMSLVNQDTVRIEATFAEDNGVLFPSKTGDILHWVDFRVMDVHHHGLILDVSRYDVYQDLGYERTGYVSTEIDSTDYDRAIIVYMLLDWSLSDLERDGDYLTQESVESIFRHPAPVVDEFVKRYEKTFRITGEEEKIINQQASRLFAGSGGGVSNACEAVALYCMLGNMWEKFGLNYYDLQHFPYRKYMMLRMMIDKDVDASRRRMESTKKTSTGRGGNVRITKPL